MLRYLIVRICTQLANWEIAWWVSSVKSTTIIDKTKDRLNAGLFLCVAFPLIFALQETWKYLPSLAAAAADDFGRLQSSRGSPLRSGAALKAIALTNNSHQLANS